MYADLECSPQTAPPDSPPDGPLQVAATLSAPYSGTTLFAILLARHSQLSSDGETFPQCENRPVTCSCGELQIECPYYRQAAGHMLTTDGRNWNAPLFTSYPVYSRFAAIDSVAGRLWPYAPLHTAQGFLKQNVVRSWRRQDEAFVAAHVQFMENSLRMRNARVYVDGCKSIRRALLFAGSGRARMKVVHLIRDGRGFCFSYLNNNRLKRSQLPQAARAWLKEIRAVERFQERCPHLPVLNVRYEDLCHDLPQTLSRVCEFLEVPYEPAMESPDARPCHVLGNRMRLTFSGKVELCLRWQREFTAQEIGYLNRYLGPTLERYHYSV